MLQLIQVVLFLIGIMNADPNRITELQQAQALIVQDLGDQTQTTTTNTIQNINTNQTQGVVQSVPQILSFSISPEQMITDATTTFTVTANQGVFSDSSEFKVGGVASIGTKDVGNLNAYNVSSDGTQASFDLYIPDGTYTALYVWLEGVSNQTSPAVGNVRVNNTVQ